VADLREFLDHARSEQRFERLWLIAAPALLGQLRNAFSKPVRRRVELEIDKDLTTDTPGEILRRALDAREAKRERSARASEQSWTLLSASVR
jgi:protein required for attachment to host cells